MRMLKYYKNRGKFLRSLFSAVDDAARQGEYFSPSFFKVIYCLHLKIQMCHKLLNVENLLLIFQINIIKF